jgi:hypothetical protein
MKSPGQRLYEFKCPAQIRVVPASCLPFATAGDALWVDNPVHQAPWHLLTQDCRASWERTAEGHSLFTGERA